MKGEIREKSDLIFPVGTAGYFFPLKKNILEIKMLNTYSDIMLYVIYMIISPFIRCFNIKIPFLIYLLVLLHSQ
jgi:hypothetical protein